MREPSSAKPLMANLLVRLAGQLEFMSILAGVALETLTSHNKVKLGDKDLYVY